MTIQDDEIKRLRAFEEAAKKERRRIQGEKRKPRTPDGRRFAREEKKENNPLPIPLNDNPIRSQDTKAENPVNAIQAQGSNFTPSEQEFLELAARDPLVFAAGALGHHASVDFCQFHRDLVGDLYSAITGLPYAPSTLYKSTADVQSSVTLVAPLAKSLESLEAIEQKAALSSLAETDGALLPGGVLSDASCTKSMGSLGNDASATTVNAMTIHHSTLPLEEQATSVPSDPGRRGMAPVGVARERLVPPDFSEQLEHIDTKHQPRKIWKGKRKIVVAAPRGHAKTTVLMIMVLWAVCYRMRKYILLVSDSEDQSKLQLDAVKAELESNEILRRLYGDLVGRYWGLEAIETSTGIRIQCRGAGQRIRGLKYRNQRPDAILCDDLMSDELVETEERRTKLKRWFFGALLPAGSPDVVICVVGTILHEADLLSELLEIGVGWIKRRYACEETGVVLWPQRYSKDDLDEIRAEYEEKGELSLFFREYYNQIVGNEQCPFQKEQFQHLTEKEYDEKFKNSYVLTYITVDPAYTTQSKADYTAFCVVSLDNTRKWYVRRIMRGRWPQSQIIEILFDLVELYKPLLVGMQKQDWTRVFKAPVMEEQRRRNKFFAVRETQTYSPNTKGLANKTSRIGRLASYYKARAIYHVTGSQVSNLEAELLAFPYAKHDDCSDALSIIVDIAFPPTETKSQKRPRWMNDDSDDYGKISGYN